MEERRKARVSLTATRSTMAGKRDGRRATSLPRSLRRSLSRGVCGRQGIYRLRRDDPFCNTPKALTDSHCAVRGASNAINRTCTLFSLPSVSFFQYLDPRQPSFIVLDTDS